jgi:hypothetical protein
MVSEFPALEVTYISAYRGLGRMQRFFALYGCTRYPFSDKLSIHGLAFEDFVCVGIISQQMSFISV